MRKKTLLGIAVSVLFLFIGKQPVFAQTNDFLMTVKIPFDFQVNKKVLPAGKYVIRRDSGATQLLLIQCPEKHVWMAVHTIPHSVSERWVTSSLIFRGYGDRYFLSEVKVLGRGEGYVLAKSKEERRLTQVAIAQSVSAVTNVAAADK